MNHVETHLSELILTALDGITWDYLSHNALLDPSQLEEFGGYYAGKETEGIYMDRIQEMESKAAVCIKAGILSRVIWDKTKIQSKFYRACIDDINDYNNCNITAF